MLHKIQNFRAPTSKERVVAPLSQDGMSQEPSFCLVIIGDKNNLYDSTSLLFRDVPELFLYNPITYVVRVPMVLIKTRTRNLDLYTTQNEDVVA